MKKFFLAGFASLALLASAALPVAAADITVPGLGTVGAIGAIGLVGGTTGSGSYSGGQATAYKTPELGGNGTVKSGYDSYGLAESSLKGNVSQGYAGGQNGFAASLNLASGALSTSGASLTAPGSASSSSSSYGGGSTVTLGGGAGLALR